MVCLNEGPRALVLTHSPSSTLAATPHQRTRSLPVCRCQMAHIKLQNLTRQYFHHGAPLHIGILYLHFTHCIALLSKKLKIENMDAIQNQTIY